MTSLCHQDLNNKFKFLINNVHIDVVGTFISEINGDGETTRGLVRYPEQHG